MSGTDSLERAAEALQGRKFCEFTLFSSSLHETSSFCSAPTRAPRWSEISSSGLTGRGRKPLHSQTKTEKTLMVWLEERWAKE